MSTFLMQLYVGVLVDQFARFRDREEREKAEGRRKVGVVYRWCIHSATFGGVSTVLPLVVYPQCYRYYCLYATAPFTAPFTPPEQRGAYVINAVVAGGETVCCA
jgi:hypothetical protein